MKAGTAAAPRYRRQVGLAAAVLAVFGGLGFAASQALAGEALLPQVGTETTPTTSTGGSTTAAPIPDPQPAPKPDPKPARPRQRGRASPPSPPPPPPPPERAARSTARTTATPVGRVPPTSMPRAERRETEAPAVATQVRRRPRIRVVPNVRPEPPARRTKPVRRGPSRGSAAPPASQTLAVDASPIPTFSETGSSPSGVPALVLPLLGLGLLLLGASAVSARRVPWPALVGPLEAHRLDLAVVGIGAIALALLWLNVTVF